MSARILYVAPRVPYPVDNGWNQRLSHTLEGLARVGDVDLVAYDAAGAGGADLGPLPDLCRSIRVVEPPSGPLPGAPLTLPGFRRHVLCFPHPLHSGRRASSSRGRWASQQASSCSIPARRTRSLP